MRTAATKMITQNLAAAAVFFLLLLTGCQPAPPPPALPTIGVLTTLTPVEKAIAIGITLPAFPVASLTPSTTPTLTPTITPSSTPTLTPTPTPRPLVAGVKPNWTPQTQDFNGVAMVLVPSGCFMMGSDHNYSDEKPTHQVCFEQPFWIDKYEVTQAQFKQFGGKAANASYFTSDNLPREKITWFESHAFCEARGGRLPTEAEWEYAARGPESLIYPWGNIFVANNVVYSGNSGSKTAPVGSRPGGTSWVGALDLSGNVWEWVSSQYQPYPYKADDGRESISDTNSHRVLRGGSWRNDLDYLRAALRNWSAPAYGNNLIGFRCARSYN